MTKNRRTRIAARDDAWGVTVRLNDGGIRYFTGQDARRGGREWASEAQAFRFPSETEAQNYVATCQTNSKAWGYEVVRLPEPRKAR